MTMVQGNSFDMKQTIRLTDRLGVEVCGNLAIPLPDSQYTWGGRVGEGHLSLGSGDLHVQLGQVNAVVNL